MFVKKTKNNVSQFEYRGYRTMPSIEIKILDGIGRASYIRVGGQPFGLKQFRVGGTSYFRVGSYD